MAVLLTTFVYLLLFEQFIHAHYMAPGLGLMVLAVLYRLQSFRAMKVRGTVIGPAFVAAMLAFSSSLLIADTIKQIADARDAPLTLLRFRAQTLDHLSAKPGRHLVMVRYGPGHDPVAEHVYNGPDIDTQKGRVGD